ENVAKQWNISREEQDQYALKSQLKCAAALQAGHFSSEIIPVLVQTRAGTQEVRQDEFPRPDSTIEGLRKLQPAFIKDGSGTVTAGNTSGINDGAAVVVLMSRDDAEQNGITPIARIVSWAQAGVDPSVMGTGPILATNRALEKAGWRINDVDLFELNEAFAAQSVAVIRELGMDPSK
ncbi:hypothetical protein ACJMK2_028795, partial [Sinanodonta woodiana]